MSNSFAVVSTQQLKKALGIRQKIESLEQELEDIISPVRRGPGRPGGRQVKPLRKMPAAAKAKLAAIAKARWRKAKAAGKTRL